MSDEKREAWQFEPLRVVIEYDEQGNPLPPADLVLKRVRIEEDDA